MEEKGEFWGKNKRKEEELEERYKNEGDVGIKSSFHLIYGHFCCVFREFHG